METDKSIKAQDEWLKAQGPRHKIQITLLNHKLFIMHSQQNLSEVIAKAFGITPNDITDELEYQSIPEWDSVSHLVLVTELEAAYGITIEMEDVLTMGSVAQVKELLKKYNVEQVA
jgi:acyl carrier protein